MALDIAALFGAYNFGTKALLEAAGLPPSMYADTAPAPAAAPATGGAVAPAPGPQTPADYLAAAMRYQSKHGRPLLEALAARHSPKVNVAKGTVTGPISAVPGSSGNALERLVHTATHGPRAGQGFQEFDLGGGRFAHTYYSPGGKRKVITFRR